MQWNSVNAWKILSWENQSDFTFKINDLQKGWDDYICFMEAKVTVQPK